MTTSATTRKQLQTLEKATRGALRSKKAARAFLVRAGILAKGGKKLAAPYR